MDAKTSLPPTEETEDYYRWLNTIYDLEIITSYKGGVFYPAQIRTDGGLKDYRVEEQLEVMRSGNAYHYGNGIPIMEGIPEIKIGEIYLFVLGQFETGLPSNLIPQQSFYNLQNPFKKNTLGEIELDDPAKYYSEKKDPYGNPIISAKDVISTFGQEKWNDFWSQWQKDNPGWETKLGKMSVEKALEN